MKENKLAPVCPVATFGPLLDVGPFTAPKLKTGAGLAWSVAAGPVNENNGDGLL